MKFVYVFDAYCGWSHGFSPTLREVTARHPGLPVEVVSGGLFTGTRRVPIRDFGYSEAAARGFAALRAAAPDRAVELAVALQRAFYVDGHSLSAPDTYRKVADAAGLDAGAVVAAFSGDAADADFRRAAELAVTGFPTLLAVHGDTTAVLARGNATADQVDRRLTVLTH